MCKDVLFVGCVFRKRGILVICIFLFVFIWYNILKYFIWKIYFMLIVLKWKKSDVKICYVSDGMLVIFFNVNC